MAYSRIPKHQDKKKKTNAQLVYFDCISILKQLNISWPTSNHDVSLSRKESFLSQVLKIENKTQYEKLLSSTEAWLLKYFDAESQDGTNEDALFVYALLHLIVKKNEPKVIFLKLSEAISYINSVDIRHLLFLFRAYVLINNQTIENNTLAKIDVERLLKENCNSIILEHVKKIQKILNSSNLINQRIAPDKERALNAELCLRQMLEHIINKNYIAAYETGDEFYLSENFSVDDLIKPEDFYVHYLCEIVYLYSVLNLNKNHELILKLQNLKITKEELHDQIVTIFESYIEVSPEKHLFWPRLINSVTSRFIDESDPVIALNALSLIKKYYDDFVHDAPELNSITNIALFQKKAKELNEITTSELEKARISLYLELLNQFKLLNIEPFLPAQRVLEPQYLEYRNSTLELLEKLNVATNNKDYLELTIKARDILFHFDKNQSQDGSFDLAFFIISLCHFAFNNKLVSISLAEGIDYCVNNEIKYILILMQSYQNLTHKEYDRYYKNISMLRDEALQNTMIMKKYQPILQKIISFYEDHHQKNIKETVKENDVPNSKETIDTHSKLELVHQKLSESKYNTAYELAKSFAREMEGNNVNSFILYQIYLSKIYLAFCYDQSMRSKVRLDQETCFANLLRTINDALKYSTSKHDTWEQLIKYAVSDSEDNKKSLHFMHSLNKAFNHTSISQSYYCVTAEGLIKRTFNMFKQKHEKDLEELKKHARDEALKNKKMNQDIRNLQKQFSKQARKEAYQERVKNKLEKNTEVKTDNLPQMELENTLEDNLPITHTKKNANKQKRKKEKRKLIREKMAEYRKNKEEGETPLESEERVQHVSSSVVKSPAVLINSIPIQLDDNNQKKPTPAQNAERRLKKDEIKRNAENVNSILKNNIRLEHIIKLHETNKLLSSLNTHLTLTGSFITKMGVLLYHSNPEKSKQILCKDIDAFVNTKNLTEFKEVIKLLNQAGFIQKTPTESNHPKNGIKINKFVKFELIFQDLKFDITIRSPSYQTYEYIPISSGCAVFSEQNKLDKNDNLILFDDQEHNTSFSLSILPDQEFKESCRDLCFSLHKPNPVTTLYCFRIFKLFQNLDDLIKIKNIDEILKIAESYFIQEIRTNNHSKINSVYYDLIEFFNNNVVSESNAQRYIQLLCKALLSRTMNDTQLYNDAPETLLFPILVKLDQANVFSKDIKRFQHQMDTLINHFIFEYKFKSDIQSLSKKNNNEFINMMGNLLNQIANDPYYFDATKPSLFTEKMLPSELSAQHVSINPSQ